MIFSIRRRGKQAVRAGTRRSREIERAFHGAARPENSKYTFRLMPLEACPMPGGHRHWTENPARRQACEHARSTATTTPIRGMAARRIWPRRSVACHLQASGRARSVRPTRHLASRFTPRSGIRYTSVAPLRAVQRPSRRARAWCDEGDYGSMSSFPCRSRNRSVGAAAAGAWGHHERHE